VEENFAAICFEIWRRKRMFECIVVGFQSGEIAKHLDFVGHGIRTQLDEIKRKEVDRLRQIIRLQMKLQHGMKDDDDDDDDDDDAHAADAGRRGIVCLLVIFHFSAFFCEPGLLNFHVTDMVRN